MVRRLTLALVLIAPVLAYADSIKEVADYLKDNSVLPLRHHEARDLADNILDAQAACPELNSLLLSETAVLRAISIEAQYGYATECDPTNCSMRGRKASWRSILMLMSH